MTTLKLPVSRRSNTADAWRKGMNNRAEAHFQESQRNDLSETVVDSPVADGGNEVVALYQVSNENGKTDGVTDRLAVHLLLPQRREKYTEDVVDHPPTDPVHASYTYFDIFIGIVSIGSYLFDVGSDVFVAVMYYRDELWLWFGLTVSFIVVPSITISLFSLSWYLQDRKTDGSGILKNGPLRWVSRFMLLILQLGPVLRYVDTMIFGMRSKRASSETDAEMKLRWYREKLWEDTDSSLLRLIECFLEAAPQLTLQLYIIVMLGFKENVFLIIGQTFSCISSLCSISWALATYQRALRLSLDTKANLTYRAMFVMFLWRIFTVGARVLSFALFASCFGYWVFVVVGSHYCVMLAWILVQNTKFCSNKYEELFFNLVAAAISIFCFFNLVEGHTRARYVLFYTLVYLENMAMIVSWYTIRRTDTAWYITPSMFVVLLLFFVGIAFQLLYYLYCHPNNSSKNPEIRPIRCCVPWVELWSQSFSERSKGSHNVIAHQNANA